MNRLISTSIAPPSLQHFQTEPNPPFANHSPFSKLEQLRPLFEKKIQPLEGRLSAESKQQIWTLWVGYAKYCEEFVSEKLGEVHDPKEVRGCLAEACALRHLEEIRPMLHIDFEEAGHRCSEGNRALSSSSHPNSVRALKTTAEEVLSEAEATPEEKSSYWALLQNKRLPELIDTVDEKMKTCRYWSNEACKQEILEEYRQRAIVALQRETERLIYA